MKNVGRIASLTVLMCLAFAAFAQESKELKPKDSPAFQSLMLATADKAKYEAEAEAKRQQAIAELGSTNKPLIDKMQALQKDLQDRLKKDHHYSKQLAEIEAIQSQLSEAGKKAQATFTSTVGPIHLKVQEDKAKIDALVPIVRKENGFPDDSQFNEQTKKWEVPKK